MGKIEKGFISTIEGPADWYGHPTRAKVNPATNNGAVTRPLTIPWYLRGKIGALEIETPVAYCVFDDGTGVIIDRMDGEFTGIIDYDTTTTGDVVNNKTTTHDGAVHSKDVTKIDKTLAVTMQITGSGGLAVSGGSGARVEGSMETTGDVKAGGISLQGHTHTSQGEYAETSSSH